MSAATHRPKAAFLHIAKCAGSSVATSFVEAAGQPEQPFQQFDRCYVAGLEVAIDVSALNPHARAVVAWDDRPAFSGDFLFRQHWSLPTIRQFFEPTDIVTVLREPHMRLLSYLEYIRAVPLAGHRLWLPDTVGLELVRSSMVDALSLPLGSRATDNLLVRQVLWGDPRLPIGRMIDPADAAGLAHDAIARLETLGLVALVEQRDRMWDVLSTWFGQPLHARRENRTATRPTPGLLQHGDIPQVLDLLDQRTAADSIVWSHFAELAGIDAERAQSTDAVVERLTAIEERSRGAEYRRPRHVTTGRRPSPGDTSSASLVLVVDAQPSETPESQVVHSVLWSAPGQAPTNAALVVSITEPADVTLRDALAGYEYSSIIVGRSAAPRLRALVGSLGDVLRPDAHLIVHTAGRRASADAASLLRELGFDSITAGRHMVVAVHERSAVTAPASYEGSVVARMGRSLRRAVRTSASVAWRRLRRS